MSVPGFRVVASLSPSRAQFVADSRSLEAFPKGAVVEPALPRACYELCFMCGYRPSVTVCRACLICSNPI